MKVEISREKLLSNYEVLEHINDLKRKRKKSAGKYSTMRKTENLETILLELQGYLKGSPAAKQSANGMRKFLEEMSIYKLEKAEKLMIINNTPNSDATLSSLIEEAMERFTQDERNHMLELIETHLM
ncbi:RNA polymerase [Lipomyces arxii]|uniref:RNA polymerase n=1 Tax=Lipomyces arxii TaxID=56418 RepID=UPI0034CD69F4